MIFRRSKPEDVPAMLEIVRDAVAYLALNGVPQWQDGYPNEAVLRSDIEKGISYVIEDGGSVAAMTVVSFDGDPCYLDIDGAWLNDEPYGVVHRCAVSDKYRGQKFGDAIFDEAEKLCREKGIYNLRVDTHTDNRVMGSLLRKHGFTLCGVIEVDTATTDALRDAYQKILE